MQEQKRLSDHYSSDKKSNWLDWGPYLSERQWGTVREDYSSNGDVWEYFPHDQARSRAYRWGEDGLMGISDIRGNVCFAVALWNGKDPIIKERLFGLTGPEGNHAEDVKELYYYLDSTPTHSYMKALYKYPHAAYPYMELIEENRKRGRMDREYEIEDTGIFDNQKYFDVFTEYAKVSGQDTFIKITVANRANHDAPIFLMPTLWCRNYWDFEYDKEKPIIEAFDTTHKDSSACKISHPNLDDYYLYFETPDRLLFTENETNQERIFHQPNKSPFVKDSINNAVIHQNFSLFDNHDSGTKVSPYYHRNVPANGEIVVYLRLTNKPVKGNPFGKKCTDTFTKRKKEADQFYSKKIDKKLSEDIKNIKRQAFAGMLWTKQFYYIDTNRWLDGDKAYPNPPESRKRIRNFDWRTLNNRDIISMPDKWEYPWYAAWDLAFHCVPLAELDLEFSKHQLSLFLREWYMHPNGQLPAYEWNFGDVNPPVHAWGCLQVYKIGLKNTGEKDIDFLKSVFQKLVINFTWWVNQKDKNGNNIFEGGFLGLDNIGVFDRSKEIPGGGILEQADGTAWMGMYCLNMLEMAIEIALVDKSFEGMATKFYEHFIHIAASLNKRGQGMINTWNELDDFFYDVLTFPGTGRPNIPVRVRSLVGLSTLFATYTLELEKLRQLPDFHKRIKWYRQYRIENNLYQVVETMNENEDVLLSLLPKSRAEKLIQTIFDPKEFLSPYGIRSLSKIHQNGYQINVNSQTFGLTYEPGESQSGLFGGNSNWRGPIWFPMNYLLIESLRKYHDFYGNELMVTFPSGSDNQIPLDIAADHIATLLQGIFIKKEDHTRAVYGHHHLYQHDPFFQNLILFYEYFHGDNGLGLGASHQTGWTGLVAVL